MKLLVTGGCGFIGSNFIRRHLAGTDDSIVNLDALTYAANPASLADFEGDPRYSFIRGRVEDRDLVRDVIRDVDAIVHFAAESHVDRSIDDAAPFVTTNALGTQVLLDAARNAGVRRFVHVSTDEVYGTLGEYGEFTEVTPLRPRSPYAASKAAGEMLARSYWETYRLPVTVVRPSNNYGPYQFPEKFVPLMVTNLIEGRKIPVYGCGVNVRDWLHVGDCCRAIGLVLARGEPGEVYNVGGRSERRNIEVARLVIRLMGSDEEKIEYVPDRPGHDFRYALDIAKIARELGWRPEVEFEEGLRETVEWYRAHPAWWRPLIGRLERESRGFWTPGSDVG